MEHTYKPKKRYTLKNEKLIEIISELCNYVTNQEIDGVMKRTYGNAFIHGNEKSLELITSAVNNDGSTSIFTLATLSKGKKGLSFRVYAHPNVVVDPSRLYEIAEKYKVINKNLKATKSNFEEYKHHQWHNDGYRTARSSLTKSTPWKWKPKYTGNIDKRKTPPQ